MFFKLVKELKKFAKIGNGLSSEVMYNYWKAIVLTRRHFDASQFLFFSAVNSARH